MEKIFDLPAHPLLVHFSVVLTPLVALAVVLLALRPAWRRSFGWTVLGATAVTFVSAIFAKQSGEKFFELLDREPSISRHEDLANQSMVLLFVFLLAVAAFVVVGHLFDRKATAADGAAADAAPAARRGLPPVLAALALVAVVAGVLSTVWVARTGHEGAKSHWSFVTDAED